MWIVFHLVERLENDFRTGIVVGVNHDEIGLRGFDGLDNVTDVGFQQVPIRWWTG